MDFDLENASKMLPASSPKPLKNRFFFFDRFWRDLGTPRLPISTIGGRLRGGPGAWGRVRVGVNPTLSPVRFEAQAGSLPLNALPEGAGGLLFDMGSETTVF